MVFNLGSTVIKILTITYNPAHNAKVNWKLVFSNMTPDIRKLTAILSDNTPSATLIRIVRLSDVEMSLR